MSEKMREEFEAAVRRDWPSANFNRCDVPGSLRAGQYVDECIQHAWWGWQASRESLVINLPETRYTWGTSDEFKRGCRDAIDACKTRILAAGLKVKVKVKP